MSASPDSSNEPEKLALEKGQRVLLCDSGGSGQRPVVEYILAVSSSGEKRINEAFDRLFQEVMRIRKSKSQP